MIPTSPAHEQRFTEVEQSTAMDEINSNHMKKDGSYNGRNLGNMETKIVQNNVNSVNKSEISIPVAYRI